MNSVDMKKYSFPIGFLGAVLTGALSFAVGNSWVTTYERAAIGFLALFVTTSIVAPILKNILSDLHRVESSVKSGQHIDLLMDEEIPNYEPAADFVPWNLRSADEVRR